MVMVRYGLVAALLALLSLSSSCLTVADDEGPILSVELYWDEEADSGFEGGTCESAGVDEMEWTLLDENGDEVQTSLSGDRDSIHPCYNAIDILGLDPGTYRLEITGYDENELPRWTETSGELQVLRFDVSYRFDIPE
jgi:hypothetical protein